MKNVVLNIETLGIDFSNGITHEFEYELMASGCFGHVPLDMLTTKNGLGVLVVHNCDINKLTRPDAVVYQTDSDEDWKVWFEANTVQEPIE